MTSGCGAVEGARGPRDNPPGFQPPPCLSNAVWLSECPLTSLGLSSFSCTVGRTSSTLGCGDNGVNVSAGSWLSKSMVLYYASYEPTCRLPGLLLPCFGHDQSVLFPASQVFAISDPAQQTCLDSQARMAVCSEELGMCPPQDPRLSHMPAPAI